MAGVAGGQLAGPQPRAGTLAGVIYDGHDIADAVGSGHLRITGDATAVERFFTLSTLPDRAPA